MTIKKGDKVFIVRLKRWGNVVGTRARAFRVNVDGLEVVCLGPELTKDPPKEMGKKSNKIKVNACYKVSHSKRSGYSIDKRGSASHSDKKAIGKLDLHGKRVAEALAEVERFIDRAIIADLDRLEIVHGVGTGKIMMALHKYLSTQSVVSSYKLDDYNPGVTWIYL